MGSVCNGQDNSQSNLPNQEKSSLPSLTKSNLLISRNINQLLTKSGRMINQYEIRNIPLILVAGGDNDHKSFVRLFLIYSFYIAKYNPKETQFETIFYQLAQKSQTDPQQKAKIQEMKNAYKTQTNDLKKSIVLINYFFNSKFIVDNINQILFVSDDPKDIGHLTFPIARLFNGIKSNFANNVRSKKRNPIYIVAELDNQEKKSIKNILRKQCCFSFAIFMKGFTDQKMALQKFKTLQKANKQNKSQKVPIMFNINFPYKIDKMQAKYDYGYFISSDPSTKKEGDVLLNIMNTFKVVQKFSETQYDLDYGYLPYLYHAKYTDRTPNIDTSIIRVFDLCCAVSSNYLKSQSCLFRVIKNQEDSLKVSQSIIAQTNPSSNQSQSSIVEIQNMINNYIDDRLYGEALQLAEKYSSSDLIKAKKLQIYFKQEQYETARKYLQGIVIKKNSEQITQAEEIIEFIGAKLLILDNKKQKAKDKLKNLQQRMVKKYEGNYEVIGSDVIKAIEEVYGGAKDSPADEGLVKSMRQAKQTIQVSALNLRGISTSI